jgi:hypothetical protein
MELPKTLYHGTSIKAAKSILKDGFMRGKEGSYTGTAVNLSECMTIAYEYGSYESRGCVLAVELSEDTKWEDIGYGPKGGNFDRYFVVSGKDAACTFSGNVWLLWNTDMIKTAQILSHQDAITILVGEFVEDGNQMAYNGEVEDYNQAYWEGASNEAANTLRRFSLMNTVTAE